MSAVEGDKDRKKERKSMQRRESEGKGKKNKENIQREGKKEKKGRVICDIRGHWFETLVQVLEITQIKNSYQKKFEKKNTKLDMKHGFFIRR